MGLLSPYALAGLGLVSMAASYLHIVWLLLGTWEIASARSAPTRTVRLLLALGAAAVALRATDKILRYSIDRPAVELLYLLLDPLALGDIGDDCDACAPAVEVEIV